MSADYSKLRGKIKEVYGTQEKFAKAIGISQVSLSQRLNGRLDWNQSEIKDSCSVLDIPKSEITAYFFNIKV